MPPRLHISGVDEGQDERGTRRLCTLVLTDLVESTSLLQARGDADAAEVFRRVHRLEHDLLTERDGLEIDRTDGHLVLFDLPLAAVEYAVTLHTRIAELGSALGVTLSCRAAVHVGEVIVRENAPEDVARGAKPLEIEGLAKPATARLLSLALPHQTLLGRTAYELAHRAAVGQPAFDRYVWASYGEYHFKGLAEPFDVHEVGLAGRAPLQAPPDSQKAHRSTKRVRAPALRRRALWLLLVPLTAVALVSGRYVVRRDTPSSPAAPSLAQFIVNPAGTGVSVQGACLGSPLAISHDGHTVAYTASDATGHVGIVVRSLDALEVRSTHLGSTPLGPAGAQSFAGNAPGPDDRWFGNSRDAFFSPDDRSLGFFQGNQLGSVLLDGGSPQHVVDQDATLGVERTGGGKGAVWTSAGIVAAPDMWSGLARFPLDGGSAVTLTTPDAARGETSHRWPDLLPDGCHLLVSIKTQSLTSFDDAEIGVVGIEGGAPEVVWRGGYYPRYSPSGHIVFARQGSLMAVPFDASRRVVTGPAVTVLRDVTMSPDSGTAAFAIGGNGTLVYVPGGNCKVETQIVWTSPDGSQEAIDLPAGFYRVPSLSPDGTRVAVDLMGAYDTLYVFHLQRKTLTRVTFNGNAGGAVWEPDGEHLLVWILDADGSDVVRVRADGTGEPQLLHRAPPSSGVGLYQWVSVDGRPALLGRIDGQGIVLFSLEPEAKVTSVVAESHSEFDAALSPNGGCLAYASTESGRSEIYVRPFPAGIGRAQVSGEGGQLPLWSRDGQLLLYTPADGKADPSRRVAVHTTPGDCLAIPPGTPIPMAAPPGERVLDVREVPPPSGSLDVVAIQGWAATLTAPAH